jgi:predicted nucleotidyltransferase
MEGIKIEISEEIKKKLPNTYKILKDSGLMIHPYVYKVVLTGSRGLAGNYRKDSDIDLSLLLDTMNLKSNEGEEKVLKKVLEITLSNWKSEIELDTAVVFDICNCQLSCFNCETSKEKLCKEKGIDCFGLYKIQKGFNGYVPKIGIDIERVYPMMTVYERKRIL